MKKWMPITLFCSLAVALVFSLQAIAAPGQGREGKVAPWEAMKIAEAHTKGRAIQATYEFEDGHWQYAVIVVAKGKLWEVELNSVTGKVGDVETADPAGEGKEFEDDLRSALKKG